jgi:transcription-repair coupling factor (superfamily II helicase)
LSNLRQKPELEIMSEEICDRFGSPPQEVRNLLALMSLRLCLKNMGIIRLDVGRNFLTLTISSDHGRDPKRLIERVNSEPRKFYFLSPTRLRVSVGSLSPTEDLPKIEKVIEGLYLA